MPGSQNSPGRLKLWKEGEYAVRIVQDLKLELPVKLIISNRWRLELNPNGLMWTDQFIPNDPLHEEQAFLFHRALAFSLHKDGSQARATVVPGILEIKFGDEGEGLRYAIGKLTAIAEATGFLQQGSFNDIAQILRTRKCTRPIPYSSITS